MTAAEPIQLLGLKGVVEIKRWLEATTWLDLPANSYENEVQCTVQTCGGPKLFDLNGRFRGSGGNCRDVVVECKKYSVVGVQAGEFKRFLAIAYSHTVWYMNTCSQDPGLIFFWVTSHPFSQTKWSQLRSAQYLKESVLDSNNSDLLPPGGIDEDLIRQVAERIWVLVVSDQQHKLSLTKRELGKFLTKVDRDKGGIWGIM